MTDTEQMSRFLSLCLALCSERDREKLLTNILDTAMDISNCDAGTLYLLEDDGLHFLRMVTRSQHIRQGGHEAPITLPPVPLNPIYVCSWVVLHNSLINVADVGTDERFDFSGSKRYDAMTGYHTKTMMVVPLADDRGSLIGVLQLINALDADGMTIPFVSEQELPVSAMASQAAISLTNMLYAEQITSLLNSLVGALSTAIDERTPYNANHTRNMVRYASAFLAWLDDSGHPMAFDEDKQRTFLLSVWLHDVGKLVVPLDVMDKATRLGAGLDDIRARFSRMKLLDKIDALEGKLSAQEAELRNTERNEALSFIERINAAGFLPDGDLEKVGILARKTYTEEDGNVCPWITSGEAVSLSVRKGTLTAEERAVMESHVSVTARILSHVTFPKRYAQVPAWASAHHELLNGKGYPEHKTGEDIPAEVRLLTILDVFDALTARDRPYKPPMPVEKALSILHSMVSEGSIDGEMLALFEESRAWE